MDNNQEHSEMPFIIGMVSLLLALIFLGLALYVFPALVLGLDYNLPEYIVHMQFYFEDNYQMSVQSSGVLVFLIFLIPGLISVYYAIKEGKILDMESNEDIRDEELRKHPAKKIKEEPSWLSSMGVIGQVVIIAISIFVLIRVLQWLIATPNP